MNTQELDALLEELLKMPKKNEWLEFKHNYHSPEEIGERISALSNGACLSQQANGYLIFGIEDETYKVLGTTFKPDQKKVKGQEL